MYCSDYYKLYDCLFFYLFVLTSLKAITKKRDCIVFPQRNRDQILSFFSKKNIHLKKKILQGFTVKDLPFLIV